MPTPQDLKNAVIFATVAGGDITCTDADGVVRWSLGLYADRLKFSDLKTFCEDGDVITLSGELSALIPGTRRQTAIPFGAEAMKSGANPDFQPTQYGEAEMRMRKLLKEVQTASDGLEKRRKSFSKAAEQKAPPKTAEPDPVIEDPIEPVVAPAEPAETPAK